MGGRLRSVPSAVASDFSLTCSWHAARYMALVPLEIKREDAVQIEAKCAALRAFSAEGLSFESRFGANHTRFALGSLAFGQQFLCRFLCVMQQNLVAAAHCDFLSGSLVAWI